MTQPAHDVAVLHGPSLGGLRSTLTPEVATPGHAPYAADRVLTPERVIERGWVAVENGVVTHVGRTAPPESAVRLTGTLTRALSTCTAMAELERRSSPPIRSR